VSTWVLVLVREHCQAIPDFAEKLIQDFPSLVASIIANCARLACGSQEDRDDFFHDYQSGSDGTSCYRTDSTDSPVIRMELETKRWQWLV